MRYLDGLNDRQREAVLTTSGPVSVLAGAGSGKTRVLTSRICHLIQEGIRPEQILAVTFTNKAAREMRERVLAALNLAESDVYSIKNEIPFIATFHGLGRELLESYGRVIGIPRYFSIFDRDDSERAVKEALKALDIDPKEVPPRAILSRISKAKGEGMTRAQFDEQHGRESFRMRTVSEAWRRYDTTLTKEKALDFDDLIALPVHLLATHDEVRQQVQERWSHIHIDEYQDTNALQGKLANMLAAKQQNLFVVGDIDQTIYTWRGATIENLLTFEKTYPNAKTIILEHNYRSTKTIVAAGNQVIEKNRNRKEKRSITDNSDGEMIRVTITLTAEREAAFVAREAAALIQRGETPDSMAVLYRTNFQSRLLEEAFLTSGVPYRLLGTQYFDRKEVKDALAWARLALEPSREADRMRAIQAPSRGIGKVTLGKILAGNQNALRPSDIVKVSKFEASVGVLTRAAETAKPSAFMRLVLRESGLEESLEKGGEDDAERLENIKELATFATRYDLLPGREGIASFLADAALSGDQDEIDRPTHTNTRGVTLMTVHAAKGLEFDTVFITGLEEGLFPHEGMSSEGRDEEEERRLFYVALTRARKQLYLTLARVRRIYGTDYASEPSSFIQDIDPALVTVTEQDTDDLPTIYV